MSNTSTNERHAHTAATVQRATSVLLVYSALALTTAFSSDVSFVDAGGGVRLPVIDQVVDATAFMIFAPIGLIAVYSYLHIFLYEMRHQAPSRDYDPRYVFELRNIAARTTSWFVHWWLCPITLLAIAWKGSVLEHWRHVAFVALCIISLQLTISAWSLVRGSETRRGWGWRWKRIGGALGVLSGVVALTIALPNRAPRLRRVDLRNQSATTLEVRHWDGADLVQADMRGAWFQSVSLTNADFRYSRLDGIRLERADLTGANFGNSDLNNAVLSDTLLRYANLRNAILRNTTMERADLTFAHLNNASAHHADFSRAKLVGAILQGSVLVRARFIDAFASSADFSSVELCEADFVNADLQDSNFDGSDMSLAELRGANLSGASLVNATLSWANLTGANLTSTDLTGSDLTEAVLTDVAGLTCEMLQMARGWHLSFRSPDLHCGSENPADDSALGIEHSHCRASHNQSQQR